MDKVSFNEGREYQRMSDRSHAIKKRCLAAGKNIIKKFPVKKFPAEANGDEYNAGWNDAIEALSKIVLDSFGEGF